ncbi:UDP-glucose/GDP-mannose dehydrogenase family protein [Desulfoprunum benzoelyticum]|uniref:UDP-glucose 6-dehydrogenase n=1 Tax=Desulfoprunum benzoelyticum TaxID=1506996 RepID=A0A840UVL1_9BACT|nr:UDP-glucose/GDP-mannose dehydrogenase family protein [Desulfoprunum benzoelyticum]MBB5348876.1 UDPglucose 6-dehydrogenase [Desulfoprunum benzoelyticum]MBM9530115.1 UDP-glucose/GDP-mannose dehydrogenase family protein [Desulfoprunum benzoelyticum]
MKITIIGTGYVGLVTGTCFAEFGHHVTCVDKDEDKIKTLLEGQIPIYEPGLDTLVQKNTREKRLTFTTDIADAVAVADAVFMAVGTPSSRRGDGYADLTYIFEAAREIAPHLKGYTVIVDKSTVPVGTARQVARVIREVNPEADFDVASNPEFLREGAAIADFMRPDRVVIGIETHKAEDILREIYKPLYLQETPIVKTDIETAELTKYAANAFLAVKISFINEIALLCDSLGADVVSLAKGIGMDGRIGKKFLHPGPGYGGSCFPKDTLAMMRIAQEHGQNLRIVEAAVEVNAAQKAKMVKKIRDMLDGSEAGKTIAFLGLTFKPETDDMRDAPAITIIPALLEKGARIKAHDPQGMAEARKYLPQGIEYTQDAYETCKNADAVVLMTEWNQYRALDLDRLIQEMQGRVFVDLRNVYEPQKMKDKGFIYAGVGRS